MNKRVLFVAQGPIEWASSRYRAWWIAEAAEWADCVQLSRLTIDATHDVVVWPKPCGVKEREVVMQLQDAGKRIIWDICDPMHWLAPDDAREMLKLVDGVVTSSPGLAFALQHELQVQATVIADRMKPAFHPTAREHRESAAPVLLWFGQAWNRAQTLGSAALGLQRLMAQGLRFRLRILDDGAGGGVNIDGIDVEYHRWRLDTFHEELTNADIALIPPYAGPWGVMKSDNKNASAMWAGLPSVDLQSWYDVDHCVQLIEDARIRAEVGAKNRAIAKRDYDIAQSVQEWEDYLKCHAMTTSAMNAGIRQK